MSVEIAHQNLEKKRVMIVDNNLHFKKFYNSIYWGYDFAEEVIGGLIYGNKLNTARQQRSKLFNLLPHTSILSVGCGTGCDFEYFPTGILSTMHIVGIDISEGMLKQCQKKFRKWNINIDLIIGMAEELPFDDNTFDIVFSFGGINFFNSPFRAVSELIRVAKHKTTVLFGDETEFFFKNSYQKLPFLHWFYRDKNINLNPLSWIPSTAINPIYHTFWDNKMYVVSFIKF